MAAYLLRRIGHGVVVVIGVVVIMFVLAHADLQRHARAALGPKATGAQITQFDRLHGYDDPLWRQFGRYVTRVARGDLGYSTSHNAPVRTLIAQRLPGTVVLVTLSTFLAIVLAVGIALWQARRAGSVADHAFSGGFNLLYATPAFLLGAVLIHVVSFRLHWLPAEFGRSGSLTDLVSNPRAMVLPVITLAAVNVAQFTRYLRASLGEALLADYSRTARAKGVPDARVLRHHALRNSLTPLITLVGLSIPAIVSGAVIVEALFNYPGMGLLAYHGAVDGDVPVVLGCAVVGAVATVLGSLVADVAYVVADPRLAHAW
jgi:peptide/nickel transport system permease protein